jgi:hypothetical protein
MNRKKFLIENYVAGSIEILNEPHEHSFSGTRAAQIVDI